MFLVNVTTVFANLGKRHISILSTRNVIWTLFCRLPHPPLEASRTFFDTVEAPEALFILQALRLSAVYERIKVHLGQGQDLIMQIYFKYKYTYENAGFCILCIDEFKILKFSNKLSKFSMIFTEKRHPPTPSSNVNMTFLVHKIDM